MELTNVFIFASSVSISSFFCYSIYNSYKSNKIRKKIKKEIKEAINIANENVCDKDFTKK